MVNVPQGFLRDCTTPSSQQERTGGGNDGPFVYNAAISKITNGLCVLMLGEIYTYWGKEKRVQKEPGRGFHIALLQ